MTNDIYTVWEQVLPLVETEMTPVGFTTWMKPLKPVFMDSDSITLSTDIELVKNMITGRYMDLLKNAILIATGKEYIVNIIITSQAEQQTIKKEEKNDSPFSKYTFDNFVIGNSNRFAQAASLAVAEAPAAAYNPLFIYGGVGLGKTHLMHAICNYIYENNKSAKIAFVSSETFTNELINALKDNKMEEFRNKYRNIDVLLIDDIQFIAGKKATEEEFFHTFNALTGANSQVVLTSDRPPSEIKTLEDRLRGRFQCGLICDIAPPDYETRIAILRKKAQNDGIKIDDSILSFIAEKITSNIRELEGIFNRVIAIKGLLQEDITIDTVIKVLKDYSNDGKSILTPEFIGEYCAKFYNVSPEKVYSTAQKKEVAFARQLSFYLCKEILDLSLKKIGQVYNRDHTTVLHGIRKIEELIEKDSVFKETVEMLIKDIKNETA